MAERCAPRDRAVEALKKLIETADRRLDGSRLAEALAANARSPMQIFETAADDLAGVPGMSAQAAEAIDLVDSLCRYVEHEKLGAHPILSDAAKARMYLRTLFIGAQLERCYLLCLDEKARLIRAASLQEGTVDRSAIYMRALAEAALRAGAKYAVLSHNHPGGSRSPSIVDIDTTVDAMRSMRAVNAILLDHIIVTRDAQVSMRALGCPKPSEWRQHAGADALAAGWLANESTKGEPV